MTLRLLATVGAATAVLAAASVAAQDTRLLNSLEVQRLVANGGPADHARLRDHFLALAAHYTAEADRQGAAARGLQGNPNRWWPAAAQPHAGRRAEQARQRALIVSGLAAHHDRRGAGLPSEPPAGFASFESGEGARAPTDAEVHQLVAAASTPNDHRALAEYYTRLAADYRTEASRHTAMAQGLDANAGRRTLSGGDLSASCARRVKRAREAEREASGHAAMHRQLAVVG